MVLCSAELQHLAESPNSDMVKLQTVPTVSGSLMYSNTFVLAVSPGITKKVGRSLLKLRIKGLALLPRLGLSAPGLPHLLGHVG